MAAAAKSSAETCSWTAAEQASAPAVFQMACRVGDVPAVREMLAAYKSCPFDAHAGDEAALRAACGTGNLDLVFMLFEAEEVVGLFRIEAGEPSSAVIAARGGHAKMAARLCQSVPDAAAQVACVREAAAEAIRVDSLKTYMFLEEVFGVVRDPSWTPSLALRTDAWQTFRHVFADHFRTATVQDVNQWLSVAFACGAWMCVEEILEWRGLHEVQTLTWSRALYHIFMQNEWDRLEWLMHLRQDWDGGFRYSMLRVLHTSAYMANRAMFRECLQAFSDRIHMPPAEACDAMVACLKERHAYTARAMLLSPACAGIEWLVRGGTYAIESPHDKELRAVREPIVGVEPDVTDVCPATKRVPHSIIALACWVDADVFAIECIDRMDMEHRGAPIAVQAAFAIACYNGQVPVMQRLLQLRGRCAVHVGARAEYAFHLACVGDPNAGTASVLLRLRGVQAVSRQVGVRPVTLAPPGAVSEKVRIACEIALTPAQWSMTDRGSRTIIARGFERAAGDAYWRVPLHFRVDIRDAGADRPEEPVPAEDVAAWALEEAQNAPQGGAAAAPDASRRRRKHSSQ